MEEGPPEDIALECATCLSICEHVQGILSSCGKKNGAVSESQKSSIYNWQDS